MQEAAKGPACLCVSDVKPVKREHKEEKSSSGSSCSSDEEEEKKEEDEEDKYEPDLDLEADFPQGKLQYVTVNLSMLRCVFYNCILNFFLFITTIYSRDPSFQVNIPMKAQCPGPRRVSDMLS